MRLKGIKRPPSSNLVWITEKKKPNQASAGITQRECVSSQPGAPNQKVSPSYSLSRVGSAWHPQVLHPWGWRGVYHSSLPSMGRQTGEVNRKQTDKYNPAMLSAMRRWHERPEEKCDQVQSTVTNWSPILHGTGQTGNLTDLVVMYSFFWKIPHMV